MDQNSLVEAPVPICIFTNHYPSELDLVKDGFGVAFKCLVLIVSGQLTATLGSSSRVVSALR